jgi:nitroimidazol reductase NimA-like FMN-containing flavoprotein (pyridoxamine 5'-phosphate oxidase superfamily)
MTSSDPTVELDREFSDEAARATPWAQARDVLEHAEIFWLSTVRVDGRPHVTPLVAVWIDDALYFCTGDNEQKAKNLERNRHSILTTGSNKFREGLDVVVEGEAAPVSDEVTLRQMAVLWESKYDWPCEVRDGVFRPQGSEEVVTVFRVAPIKAFAYARGEHDGATRYRFE